MLTEAKAPFGYPTYKLYPFIISKSLTVLGDNSDKNSDKDNIPNFFSPLQLPPFLRN